jgi:gamma-glutamyl hydrolase
VNGLLFTGGSAPLFTADGQASNYTSIGCFIFDLVRQINDEGVYYPLWATSLGFELINVCISPDPNTISTFSGEPAYAANVKFTKAAKRAVLFDTYAGSMIKRVQQSHATQLFAHEHGIAPSTYAKTAALTDFYRVVAVGHDLDSSEFIAIVEARDYPIYGSQFNIEKNLYEWSLTSPIPHNSAAVFVASYYSQFFVAEARRNSLSFDSELALKSHLIYNYKPHFMDGNFTQIYSF